MPASVTEVIVQTWGEDGSRTRWLVEGGSMWPVLRGGDVVVLAHGALPLRAGDIVLYRAGEQLVLHRLLRVDADHTLLLAGDMHEYADPPVQLDAVIGRAVAFEHDGVERSLVSRVARITSRVQVASYPLRRHRALHSIPAVLTRVSAWVVRG